MSRNSTWYTISKWSSSNVFDRSLLFYRTTRTAKKARGIVASNPGAKIRMHRYTPSSFKWLHGIIPDNSKKMRELRRLYRNFRRREADARKREERIKKREAAERVADVVSRFWRSWDTWQGGTIL